MIGKFLFIKYILTNNMSFYFKKYPQKTALGIMKNYY